MVALIYQLHSTEIWSVVWLPRKKKSAKNIWNCCVCVCEAIKELLESHRIIPFNCMAGYANIIITRRSQFCSPENVCVVPAPKLEPPRI